MTNIFICLGGIFLILVSAELLYRQKILKGEYLRKYVHITSACFAASWPWLISWPAIQIIGLIGFGLVLFDHWLKKFHFSGNIKRHTYGGILFPVGVLACTLLTKNPIFFAIAVLHLGVADGLAAVLGVYYHRFKQYRVFGYQKSVIGTLTFYLVSLCILGVGLGYAFNFLSYNDYVLALLIMPPALALIENVSISGTDNLTVPVATVLMLNLIR